MFENQSPEAKHGGQCGQLGEEGSQEEQWSPGGTASSEQEGSYCSLPFTRQKPRPGRLSPLHRVHTVTEFEPGSFLSLSLFLVQLGAPPLHVREMSGYSN